MYPRTGFTKADVLVAERYITLVEPLELRERVWIRIREEYERTVAAVLQITGEGGLMDHDPVLRRSIERRNPYVDPLSFLQLELIRRLRAEGSNASELIRPVLLSINGIAAGLRTTG